jgi:hypothetical protein
MSASIDLQADHVAEAFRTLYLGFVGLSDHHSYHILAPVYPHTADIMDGVKAVIRGPIEAVLDSDVQPHDDGPTTRDIYFFPSFPAPPPGASLKPFSQWIPKGLYLSSSGSVRDGIGLSLASGGKQPLQLHTPGAPGVVTEEMLREKKLRQLQKGKLGVRVEKDDCFKIGDENSGWVEPAGTSKSDYDP